MNLAAWYLLLATRPPYRWPWLLRAVCLMALFLALLGAGYFLVWRAQAAQLAQLEREQLRLGAALHEKQAQLQQVAAWRAQGAALKAQIAQHLHALPAQVDGVQVLEELATAARRHKVELVLARPAAPVTHALYQELPVAIKLRGRYHDLGALATDLATGSQRLVLHQLVLGNWRDGLLELDAQARALAPIRSMHGAASRDASVAYQAAGLRDPFAPAYTGAAAPGLDALSPWHARHALQDLTLVGTIAHQGTLEALVQVAGRVYRVAQGQPLGRDGGRVWAIEPHALQVRERGGLVTLRMREQAHDDKMDKAQ